MLSRPTAIVFAAMVFAICAVSGSQRSFAKGPVALATSVTGKTTPAIDAFSELHSDTRLELLPDTEIEFVHYPTCQTVVVKGGRLSFSSERYFIRKGKILTTQRTKCPKTAVLAGASQIGGLVLRGTSGGRNLRVSPNPTFALVGNGANSVEKIAISLDGKMIAEAENPGRVFKWPDNIPPLQKGQAYKVMLTIKGEEAPESFNVETLGGSSHAITLIRLD